MEYTELGQFLRQLRKLKQFSSGYVADKLGLSATYYSRLENGKERPSKKIVDNISDFYDLPGEDNRLLLQLAGFSTDTRTDSQTTESGAVAQRQMAVRLDPEKTQVLFSDGMYVTVSENGVVFDFGQKVGPKNEQVIVARVGVSLKHAEKISALLIQQIKRAKDMGVEN